MATPPVGRHGFEFVNEEKPRKLPQVHCHPLSSMRVRIELLTSYPIISMWKLFYDPVILSPILNFQCHQVIVHPSIGHRHLLFPNVAYVANDEGIIAFLTLFEKRKEV